MDQPKLDRMKITRAGLVVAAALGLAAGALGLRGCRRDDNHARYTVDQLSAQCEQALARLEDPKRLEARRPAAMDQLLRPIDLLLAKARAGMEDAGTAMEAGRMEAAEEALGAVMRSALMARGFALRGHHLALAVASAHFPKTYRFNEQRGDACRHLATARWISLRHFHPDHAPRFARDPDYQPPPSALGPILEDIAEGLEAKNEDPELHYLDGDVRLAAADFGGALSAFRRCVALKPDYTDAHAGLGKTYVMLGDLDRAQEAFEEQIRQAARDEQRGLGSDALRTALFNAAFLHDQRGQGDARPEDLDRHREAALGYYRRFLATPGAGQDPAFAEATERSAFLGRADR